MMKEIYIHVGAGKTGTSALQEFFNINKERLRKNNLTIPDIGATVAGKSIGHHSLADWGPHRVTNTIALWKDISAIKDDRILVTSEIFHSRISESDGLEFFSRIRDQFEDRNIKIIFYIRRQSEWLQSAYEQWVKANNMTLTLDQFTKSYKKNLTKQLLRFAEVFGQKNIIVKPYDRKQFEGGNIFADFLDIFNIKLSDKYQLPKGRVNPRLSPDALNFKRIFNSYCSDIHESDLVRSDLTRYSLLSNKLGTVTGSKNANSMPVALQKKIEYENRANYEKIAFEFLGRENRQLFSEEPELKTEPNIDLNEAAQPTDLYAFLFLQMYKRTEQLSKENKRLNARLKKLE